VPAEDLPPAESGPWLLAGMVDRKGQFLPCECSLVHLLANRSQWILPPGAPSWDAKGRGRSRGLSLSGRTPSANQQRVTGACRSSSTGDFLQRSSTSDGT
jgi:hypothetical protein